MPLPPPQFDAAYLAGLSPAEFQAVMQPILLERLRREALLDAMVNALTGGLEVQTETAVAEQTLFGLDTTPGLDPDDEPRVQLLINGIESTDFTVDVDAPSLTYTGAPALGDGDLLTILVWPQTTETDPLALQKANNLSDLVSAAAARGNLGLGTAALAATGTGVGNVPVLADVGGSPGLPAVDGSQLTGIHYGQRYVVGPAGQAGVTHTTVQGAIDAAEAGTRPALVYIRAGSYTEDTTVSSDGVHFDGEASHEGVTITGTCTIDISGDPGDAATSHQMEVRNILFAPGGGTSTVVTVSGDPQRVFFTDCRIWGGAAGDVDALNVDTAAGMVGLRGCDVWCSAGNTGDAIVVDAGTLRLDDGVVAEAGGGGWAIDNVAGVVWQRTGQVTATGPIRSQSAGNGTFATLLTSLWQTVGAAPALTVDGAGLTSLGLWGVQNGGAAGALVAGAGALAWTPSQTVAPVGFNDVTASTVNGGAGPVAYTSIAPGSNASNVPYTPADGGDWDNPDPTDAAAALDALAARLAVVEAAAGGPFVATAAMDAAQVIEFEALGRTGAFDAFGPPGLRGVGGRVYASLDGASVYYETPAAVAKPAGDTYVALVVRFETIGGTLRVAGRGGGGATKDVLSIRLDGDEVRFIYGDGTLFTITDTVGASLEEDTVYVIEARTTVGTQAAEIWVNGQAQAVAVDGASTGATSVGGAAGVVGIGLEGGRAGLNVPDCAIACYYEGTRLDDADRTAASNALTAFYL